ncbi:MAG: tetratricopeptide repeat protein [Alphaproteobacteria bacterium]
MKRLCLLIIASLFTLSAHALSMSDKLNAVGDSALAAGDLTAARQAYEQAVVADPADPRPRIGLGNVHLALDHPMAARQFYAGALDIEPDDLKALSGGGKADLALELEAEAEKKKERLLRLCGADCPEYKDLKQAVIAFKERPQMSEAERLAALSAKKDEDEKDGKK